MKGTVAFTSQKYLTAHTTQYLKGTTQRENGNGNRKRENQQQTEL